MSDGGHNYGASLVELENELVLVKEHQRRDIAGRSQIKRAVERCRAARASQMRFLHDLTPPDEMRLMSIVMSTAPFSGDTHAPESSHYGRDINLGHFTAFSNMDDDLLVYFDALAGKVHLQSLSGSRSMPGASMRPGSAIILVYVDKWFLHMHNKSGKAPEFFENFDGQPWERLPERNSSTMALAMSFSRAVQDN